MSETNDATLASTEGDSDGFKKLKPMSNNRHGAAGISVNDHQFLVLGASETGEYYDKKTAEWKPFPVDMPVGRSFFGAAVVGDRLFVIGGTNTDGSARSDVVSIDVSGGDLSSVAGTWKTGRKSMPGERAYFACTSLGKSIYVFGGRDKDSKVLDTALRYDTDIDKWTELPVMPGERELCAAAVVGDKKILVIGGQNWNSHERYILKSVLVFDTVKNQWESSTAVPEDDDGDGERDVVPVVPDMKTKRYSLATVVVDGFVFVIGGNSDRYISYSVEVLDTERNIWEFSPVKMTVERSDHVAGYFNSSKEIIVAGGHLETSVECVPLKKLLPRTFRLKERGLEVMSDTVRGEDKLGIEIMAIAIIEMLLFTDLIPPFTLGVLGKWGRGKSFFFNLMMDYIQELQQKEADDLYRETFVGHIYVITFDAWTFSKGKNIWSSLMYQILKELNEQLQFEQAISEAGVSGEISMLEVFRDFTTRERGYLEKYRKRLNVKDLLRFKNEGDSPSQILKEAINKNYKVDQETVKDKEKEINEKQKKLRAIEIQIENKRVRNEKEKIAKRSVSEMKAIVNFMGKKALKNALEKAFNEASRQDGKSSDISKDPPKVTVDKQDKEAAGDASGESENNPILNRANPSPAYDSTGESQNEPKRVSDGPQPNLEEALQTLEKEIEEVKENTLLYGAKLTNVPIPAVALIVVLVIVAIFLIFNEQRITGYLSAALAPFVSIFASALSTKQQMMPIFNKFCEEFSEAKDTVRNASDAELGIIDDDEELKGLNDEQKELENTLKILTKEKEDIEERLFDLTGPSLRDTISKRIDRKKYEDNLGIVHKVQQDLEMISDAMLNNNTTELFPRGKPRIVLFVDDLDRCTQAVVVEVIEALQLLVKTNLFVVILAIDPRYVTLSLEKGYEGILESQTPPTGMDFIEKIVQIPFRLPGMDEKSMSSFLDGQIKVEEEPLDLSKTNESEKSTDNTIQQDLQDQQRESVFNQRRVAENRNDVALPASKVRISRKEKEMIDRTLQIFRLGPRSVKRIINVYKILMVIWKRGRSRFQANPNLRRATLFLMLLASDELTREVTYKIFDWMEMGPMKYHHVAVCHKKDKKNNLADLFKRELKNWDNAFVLLLTQDEDETAIPGTLMAYLEEYLAEYEWSTVDEWNKLSTQFMLARCFSFYRLASEDIEKKSSR